MLPDGTLQSRSKPALSDNVKINVFWYLHTEVLIRWATRLRDPGICLFAKTVITKRIRQHHSNVSLSD